MYAVVSVYPVHIIIYNNNSNRRTPKKPYTKSPKKLLRKNFNMESKEIKLYNLKDESVNAYSSCTHSIDRSSNTLSRNNTHSSNTVVYS